VAPTRTVPTGKAGNQRTWPARQQPTAAPCELPGRATRLHPKNRSLQFGASWSPACLVTVGQRLEGVPVPSWPTLTPTALIRSGEPSRRRRTARRSATEAAEAVAEVEQEAPRVHQILADQGGPLAEQAREHADRAEDLAAKERAEARLREADRD
jgi:hypothetical protein